MAARLDTHRGDRGEVAKTVLDDRLDGLRDKPRAGRPRRFPPAAGGRGQGDRVRAAGHRWPAAVKFSRVELHRLVMERGVTDASASTIWRWLHEDAIKRGRPARGSTARPQLARRPAGCSISTTRRRRATAPDEYVICADGEWQLQARDDGTRLPCGSGRPGLVEFEYRRGGTLAYLAAWDGAAPTCSTARDEDRDRPVRPLVTRSRHRALRSARRVSGSSTTLSHCGRARAADRREPSTRPAIHLPVHASWLTRSSVLRSCNASADTERLPEPPNAHRPTDGVRSLRRSLTVRVNSAATTSRTSSRRSLTDHLTAEI